MKDFLEKINHYTICNLIQQIENLHREKCNHELISIPYLRPKFSDLLENYLKHRGLECRARSSSGNGCNYSSSGEWPNEGYNYYVPLRPEQDSYLPNLERIITDQANKQNSSPEEIVKQIFLPLETADKTVENIRNKCFDDKNTWSLSKEDRIKSKEIIDIEIQLVWQKVYDSPITS